MAGYFVAKEPPYQAKSLAENPLALSLSWTLSATTLGSGHRAGLAAGAEWGAGS
ncbi:MAG: hypothetical protein P8I46_06630 [Pseudomonadales bacterium]|nr:hypothetical protein [Pseudomonadales bacterium]